MANCCCYRKYDGSDQGCTTVAGNCPTIAGYDLVSSTPGACDRSCKASEELQGLIAAVANGSPAKDSIPEGVRSLIDKIASAGEDVPAKTKFSVELLSRPDDQKLKIRLCTGSVLDLPKSIVKNVVGPVVSKGEHDSHLYARVQFDASTPEGRVICQLAADLEATTALQRKSMGNQEAVPERESGDTKVYLYGTACKNGGNITTVTFNDPITGYSIGSLSGDDGVFIMRHRQLNSRNIEIVHDRTAVCGTSYRGDLIIYYDA